jgi:hypothetical protein
MPLVEPNAGPCQKAKLHLKLTLFFHPIFFFITIHAWYAISGKIFMQYLELSIPGMGKKKQKPRDIAYASNFDVL